jgi:hypothetical protein
LSAFEAMKHSVVIDGWTSLVICATTTIGFGAFIPGAIRFLKREQHQESTRGYGDRSGDVGPAFGLVAVLFTATIFSFFGAGYAARKILAPEYIVITKIMETVK